MENWKILNTENFIKFMRKEDEKMKIKEAEDDKELDFNEVILFYFASK